MLIDRELFRIIKETIQSEDNWIVILYGPYQAGKTTLVNSILSEMNEQYLYFTGDDLYAQKLLS